MLVYLLSGTEKYLVIITVVFLTCSLSPFFLVTTYKLSEGGVEKKFLGLKDFRAWSTFKSYYVDQNGVLLSPFTRPSMLESYRGLYIRFYGASKDKVVEFVRRKMEQV